MNKNMVKEIIIQDSERDYSNGRLYTEMIMFNEPVDFSEISKIAYENDTRIQLGKGYGIYTSKKPKMAYEI